MEQAIKKFDEARLVKLAELIVKYQKFQTSLIWLQVLKDHSIILSKTTAVNYINLGICYLKTGQKYKSIPNALYKNIDDCVARHLQPLTPTLAQERRKIARDYTKKEAKLPIEKNPVIKQELTKTFEYGVRIENRIILFDNEHSMATFIKNAKFVNPDTELQPVTVECENYER